MRTRWWRSSNLPKRQFAELNRTTSPNEHIQPCRWSNIWSLTRHTSKGCWAAELVSIETDKTYAPWRSKLTHELQHRDPTVLPQYRRAHSSPAMWIRNTSFKRRISFLPVFPTIFELKSKWQTRLHSFCRISSSIWNPLALLVCCSFPFFFFRSHALMFSYWLPPP